MGDWLADKVINRVLNWFAEMVLGALNNLWDLLSATAFQSPNVTTLPQVTTFASTSLGVVNACYVLAILAVAIMIMGRDTIQSRFGPSELIPRLVIGLIAANFGLPICSTIIDLANALTTALTSQSITSPGSMQLLRSTTAASLSTQSGVSASGFPLLLIGLLIAVLVALLMIQWIMRCGLLIVLAGIAPVALALHGTPQTEGVAKLWWRAMLGTTGTVVIQAVVLHMTLTIFLSPDANLPVLGLIVIPDAGATMNLLVVACMLFGILKVPGLMRRYVTQARPGVSGQIFRLVVIQQLTRGLSRAFGGASSARRATTAGRAVADPPWPTISTRGGGRSLPPSTSTRPAGTVRPLPHPSGAGPGRVGVAFPSGRPVRPYTPEELANGVDLYTRALKARGAANAAQGRKTP
jgi:hypothetical protein